MKGLLKLAVGSLLAMVVLRIARQWTVHALEDAEPYAPEPLQPEDLRIAQNSPL